MSDAVTLISVLDPEEGVELETFYVESRLREPTSNSFDFFVNITWDWFWMCAPPSKLLTNVFDIRSVDTFDNKKRDKTNSDSQPTAFNVANENPAESEDNHRSAECFIPTLSDCCPYRR